jgi:nucleotide-binding universal stress UspA family protein
MRRGRFGAKVAFSLIDCKAEADAKAAGVPFVGRHAQVPRVDRAIIAAAEAQGCDMIVMVTHGRGAFGEFLFGSQTKAVLAGSSLPLLVLH